MDIFSKARGLQLVQMLRKINLYPFFRKLEASTGNNVTYNGRDLVMMGSNNYLGLTHDPRVIEAGVQALKKWGSGCTGSRFLNGNIALHEELEKKLADFLGFESALVFASGFMANQGAITAIANNNDYIISDEDNHACIIEGCQLAKANTVVYKHLDMNDLERTLKSLPADAGKVVITDGVFSMTGRIAPYGQIRQIAEKYGARTYVDDAHGLGVIGEGGRGTVSHFGNKTDILMGTFSKSLASQGGFICGSNELTDWLRHKARTFMFSAALAPASTATALKSLEILIDEPERVEKSKANAKYLKEQFEAAGLNTMGTETSVVPVFIGADEAALFLCSKLLDLGVFTTPVVYPAVPRGQAIIRCSVMTTHTQKDLDIAANAFKKLAPIIKQSAESASDDLALADGLNMSPEQIQAFMKKRMEQLTALH